MDLNKGVKTNNTGMEPEEVNLMLLATLVHRAGGKVVVTFEEIAAALNPKNGSLSVFSNSGDPGFTLEIVKTPEVELDEEPDLVL